MISLLALPAGFFVGQKTVQLRMLRGREGAAPLHEGTTVLTSPRGARPCEPRRVRRKTNRLTPTQSPPEHDLTAFHGHGLSDEWLLI